MSASKNRIYFLLQRAAHRLKTEADAALSESGGLTTAQAAVMSIVAQDGPVDQINAKLDALFNDAEMAQLAERLIQIVETFQNEEP